jgi:hydrogenase/urease accessory protein HupE
MRRLWLAAAVFVLGTRPVPAFAHPAPFSYIDISVRAGGVDLAVVAHVFDIAHDLGVDQSQKLLDPAFVGAHGGDITALLQPRFHVDADERSAVCRPSSSPEIVEARQSVRVRFTCATPGKSIPGTVAVGVLMFPYDPAHQTFLNVYEGGSLRSQAILDAGRTRFEYFSGGRQGALAVVKKFVPAGIHHILIGPDHLLFLVGLLLLGGSIRQLLLVVTAFTVAHSVTLSLAALNIVSPPARIIEPAIALSIVYVGADNLLVRGGRDVRAWIALTFGFIHGFGFANVLREMELPARALGWSLFSFNVGVEIGQLFVVTAVATALAALRARSEAAGRRLALAGSMVVIAAGAFWFIERVFFPGGTL